MKKLLTLSLLALSAPALARGPANEGNTGGNYGAVSTRDVKFALGGQANYIDALGYITQLHTIIKFADRFNIGFGFGMSSSFDNALIGADFRFDFVRNSNASFYGYLGAGYLRFATVSGALIQAGPGFAYNLTNDLEMQLGIGLSMKVGAGGFSIGNNQGTLAGNFGMHWWF